MSDTLRSPDLKKDGTAKKTPLRDRVKIVRPLSRIVRLPVDPDDSQETTLDEETPPSSNRKVSIENYKQEMEI